MDEPGDEDGRLRVPSRPTVKKKDVLDDPALADAEPDLDSPGETVNQGPNHPAAVAEESHPHGVDDDLKNIVAGVSGNPDDVAPESSLHLGDTGSEAVPIVLDGVAPVDGNPDSIFAEVVQSPSNVALGGISNPNDVAQAGVVGIPASDVASGAVGNLGDTDPAATSNRDDVALAVRNSGNVSHGMARNFDDDALGAVENPNDISDVAHGVVRDPGNDELGLILNTGDGGPVSVSKANSVGLVVGTSSHAASGAIVNPEVAAIGAAQNVNDATPGAISNRNYAKQGVVGNPGNIALGGGGNSDNDALGTGQILSNVAPGADVLNLDNVAPGVNPENVVLESVLNPGYNDLVASPNLAHLAGNPSDVALGLVQNLGNVKQSEIVELEQDSALEPEHQNEDQIPRSIVQTTIENAEDHDCHGAAENHHNTAHEGTDTADEDLWRSAVAAQDCNKLTELLAKDASYFWKYEKKNEAGTTLHAAAAGGDLELAEHILIMVSWAKEAGDQDMHFVDKNLDIDGYIELERDGKTAVALARGKNHVAIETKIRDYIAADKDQVHSYDGKRSGSSVNRALPKILRWNASFKKKDLAPLEISNWNDAIKKKDCLALLKICPKKSSWDDSLSVEEKRLVHGVVDLELENGREGRQTALQTAAMQGCLQLAKLMLYNFRQVPGFIASGDDVVDYIMARDEESGLTAFEMANDVVGHRSIAEYIKATYRRHASNDKLKRMLHLNVENDEHMIGSSKWLYSFDAYPGTRWYRALENGDTRELKKLVVANSRFLLETCDGVTVLHVAILQHNLELVKVVLKLFCHMGKDGMTCIMWGKSYFPHKLSLFDMLSKRRKIGWDAFRRWIILPRRMLKKLERKGNSIMRFAKLSAKLQQQSREIVDEFLNATFMTSISNVEYLTMPSWMSNFFTKYWPSEFDEDFKQDVDFNFEDSTRKKWLRFHFACKDPLKFRGFLQEMAFYIIQHPYDATKLLQTWDGKGQTPFHILMDHYDDKMDPGWPFDEIFIHEYFKEWIQIVENPRGKRIIHIILIKNYLQQNVILRPWTYFKVNLNHETFGNSLGNSFLYYQAAHLLKQKEVLQEISCRFLKKKDLTYVMKKDKDAINSMLFLVASSGNQTWFQSLLKINQDPMITDSNGRSLLHHAADPTTLLSQLLGHCSLIVDDVSNVRRILMENNTIYDSQPSPSTSCDVNVGRKACILQLLQVGVDLGQPDKDNNVPTIGPTFDATYQSWWYDIVVKDISDKKQALSQASNALSVVGTLVAATSYVGPLQPPLGFDTDVGTGFVKTTKSLIKVFMVSNSVAFYLAMASVMFAVVSSLPMPQEGVKSELNRAKHAIALSVCLLQIAIGSVIISFASASIVAIQNEQMFHPSHLLFSPSIIGLFFCLLGIGGFLIRLARLVFYRNRVIRHIYEFSFSEHSLWVLAKCLWLIIVVLFGLVYYPLNMILACLECLSYMVPMIGGLQYRLMRMRYRLNDFFCDVFYM